MFNVTPKIHLKLSHETPSPNLARPCVNLWCMPVCKHLVFQEIIN